MHFYYELAAISTKIHIVNVDDFKIFISGDFESSHSTLVVYFPKIICRRLCLSFSALERLHASTSAFNSQK